MTMEQYDLDNQAQKPPNHCKRCGRIMASTRAQYCCNAHRQASYRERVKVGEYLKPRLPTNPPPSYYGMCQLCKTWPASWYDEEYDQMLCPLYKLDTSRRPKPEY